METNTKEWEEKAQNHFTINIHFLEMFRKTTTAEN